MAVHFLNRFSAGSSQAAVEEHRPTGRVVRDLETGGLPHAPASGDMKTALPLCEPASPTFVAKAPEDVSLFHWSHRRELLSPSLDNASRPAGR